LDDPDSSSDLEELPELLFPDLLSDLFTVPEERSPVLLEVDCPDEELLDSRVFPVAVVRLVVLGLADCRVADPEGLLSVLRVADSRLASVAVERRPSLVVADCLVPELVDLVAGLVDCRVPVPVDCLVPVDLVGEVASRLPEVFFG
jgi:hypothetical protein